MSVSRSHGRLVAVVVRYWAEPGVPVAPAVPPVSNAATDWLLGYRFRSSTAPDGAASRQLRRNWRKPGSHASSWHDGATI